MVPDAAGSKHLQTVLCYKMQSLETKPFHRKRGDNTQNSIEQVGKSRRMTHLLGNRCQLYAAVVPFLIKRMWRCRLCWVVFLVLFNRWCCWGKGASEVGSVWMQKKTVEKQNKGYSSWFCGGRYEERYLGCLPLVLSRVNWLSWMFSSFSSGKWRPSRTRRYRTCSTTFGISGQGRSKPTSFGSDTRDLKSWLMVEGWRSTETSEI